MRKAHRLQGNKAAESWRHYFFFDCETTRRKIDDTTSEDVFRLAWSCLYRLDTDSEKWQEHRTPESLCKALENATAEGITVYAFAHNIYYDIQVSFMQLYFPAHGWTLKSFYNAKSGGVFFLVLRNGKRRICFINTLNFFQCSLRELGQAVGLQKQEVDFADVDDVTLSEYCKNDVAVIRKALLDFVRFRLDNNLGNQQKTIASQSFSAFRHRFMRSPIVIHDNTAALQLEREAYHGGRVECFFVGTYHNQLHKLDVNSMYPFVMRNRVFPWRLIAFSPTSVDAETLRKYLTRYYVIADCFLDTQQDLYPVVKDKRLLFPHGSFWTVLGTAAIRESLRLGHLKKIRRIALYAQADLFSSFVDFFWSERQKAKRDNNQVYSYFHKLLLNTLYGKFAQKQQRLKRTFPCGEEEFSSGIASCEDGIFNEIRMFGVASHFEQTEEESYNSFPAISAAITEYARMYLSELIATAGQENCFYCDTDSLVVNDTGKENLRGFIGKELGQLKVEKTVSEASFFCPKDYVFGEEIKRKGISARATYNTVSDTYSQEQWQRLRGALKNGESHRYLVKEIEKKLSRELHTRTVQQNGRTEPFLLDNYDGLSYK